MKSFSTAVLLSLAAGFCSGSSLNPSPEAIPEAAPSDEMASTAAAAAAAGIQVVFVASYGKDANDGTRANPKRTLQAAHNTVAAQGEILIIDTGVFSAVKITKSVAITAAPGTTALISPGRYVPPVKVQSGAGSVVTLRGLTLQGGGNRTSSETTIANFAIWATSVGALTVEECTIRNFIDAVVFQPAESHAVLSVSKTTVRNCHYGIDVQNPSGVEHSRAHVSECRLENVGEAIYCDGSIVYLNDNTIADCDTGLHIADASIYVSNCRFQELGQLEQREGNASNSVSYQNNMVAFTSGSFKSQAIPR